jgi:hypothetical protein
VAPQIAIFNGGFWGTGSATIGRRVIGPYVEAAGGR